MLDVNKPVQTRDGSKVRIICTDAKLNSNESIVALVVGLDGWEFPFTYRSNGRYNKNKEHALDLVNIKTPRKHADVIKAWADGATVQVRVVNDWVDIHEPRFCLDEDYRVKPE